MFCTLCLVPCAREEVGFVRIKVTSSAKKDVLPIVNPEIEGFVHMCSAWGPMSRLKISGDSGHPWRKSFVMGNSWDTVSAANTCADGVE